MLRERRPDAAAGVMGGPLAGHTAGSSDSYLTGTPYSELVALFRSGPPRLSPFAIPGADEAANAVEYFVHHEDVRRAADGWARAAPRRPGSDRRAVAAAEGGPDAAARGADRVWCSRREDGGKLDLIVAKNAGSPDTGPSVTVTGSPAELTLWVMGRASAPRTSA